MGAGSFTQQDVMVGREVARQSGTGGHGGRADVALPEQVEGGFGHAKDFGHRPDNYHEMTLESAFILENL